MPTTTTTTRSSNYHHHQQRQASAGAGAQLVVEVSGTFYLLSGMRRNTYLCMYACFSQDGPWLVLGTEAHFGFGWLSADRPKNVFVFETENFPVGYFT